MSKKKTLRRIPNHPTRIPRLCTFCGDIWTTTGTGFMRHLRACDNRGKRRVIRKKRRRRAA